MTHETDEGNRGRNQMVKNAQKARRNRRRTVQEAGIDFEGIVDDLGKEKPRTIMVSEALERLVVALSEGHERGLMVGQIAEICRRRGLDVDEEEVQDALANAAAGEAGERRTG